jgi:hypothetical protein
MTKKKGYIMSEQKITERLPKKEFLALLKKSIANRKFMSNFFEREYKELLRKWDGKVLNARFVNALENELKVCAPTMYVRSRWTTCDQYTKYAGKPCMELVICCRDEITEVSVLYTHIVCKYDDNFNARINADASFEEERTIAWKDNFDKYTDEQEGIFANYNKYLKVAQTLADAATAYNDLPHAFRINMDKSYFRIS